LKIAFIVLEGEREPMFTNEALTAGGGTGAEDQVGANVKQNITK
jgi:hypothetical protein